MEDRSRPPARRLAVVLSVLALAPALIAGCGADGRAEVTATASRKAERAYTVRQLAAAVGCTAKITSKAADYRQATCSTAEATYVLLDFDTAEGQRAWLDYAEMYGGIYLVGERWALSAKSKAFMEKLRAKLGGTIEETGAYGSSPSPQSS